MIKYILTTLYVVFSSAGIMLIKLGGDSLNLNLKGSFSLKMGYITLAGLCCYLVSFLLWQKVLVSYNISYIVPITTGIIQIIVLIFSIVVLKEPYSIQSIIGVIVIVIGIVLLTSGNVK